jgi:hypothetical protein
MRASSSKPSPGAAGGLGGTLAGLSPATRWGVTGLLVVFAVGYFFIGRERSIPVGVVLPNVVVKPMTKSMANDVLKLVNDHAKVEERDGALTVQIFAVLFPEHREGQLAMAQEYARADEIMQGKKRTISFLDPTGSPFAKADPAKGVVMTR